VILLVHSGIYLLVRVIAGIAGFVGIALYTRLLSAEEFGRFTLVLTGAAFLSLLVSEGPYQAMLRHLPRYSEAARASTLWGLTIPAAILCLAATPIFLAFGPADSAVLLALGALLLSVTLLHRFQLATVQGGLEPWRYALLGIGESILEILIGIPLVMLGYGVAGALAGAIVALMVVVLLNIRSWWLSSVYFDASVWARMCKFALPLSVSAVLSWIATFSDRWLLALYWDSKQAGLYAAAYDLPLNLLGVPLAVITLAGYPLAVRAYNDGGVGAARSQLRLVGGLMLLVLIPATIGVVLIGPMLVGIFLGPEFRSLALSLLPMLAAAIFVKTLIVYTNYGYHLASRPNLLLLSMSAVAASNFVLNVLLIPRLGPLGSAAAALAAFCIGLIVSIVVVRRAFPMPRPDPIVVAAALSGVIAMTAWLGLFYEATDWISALYVIPGAVLVYSAVAGIILHRAGRGPFTLVREWQVARGRSTDVRA
jgi:O-antigen/teichoic acid export membrane protein